MALWADGRLWISPEIHGNFSGVIKNQIDWIPLSDGAVRPTQGKTRAPLGLGYGIQPTRPQSAFYSQSESRGGSFWALARRVQFE